MNSKNLVSIIVPIYNVDKYLNDCLISISDQSYNNLEILLINDGSTDNSESIAKNFHQNDKRFILYNKQNGGLSSARNFGLDNITGQYVCFIDADDYISKNFISDLVTIFETTNADVVVCGRYNVYNNSLKSVFSSENNHIWTGREALYNMMKWKNVDGSVCDKMFKAKDFQNLRFELGLISEDLPVTAKIFSKSNLVIHTGKPNYYYRQREGSITHQDYKKNKLTILDSANMVYTIVSNQYPDLKNLSKQYLLHHVNYLISIYFRSAVLSTDDENSFKIVRKAFLNLKSIYFLPNGRNILKKIFLFIIIVTKSQLIFRKMNSYLKLLN